MPTEYHFLCALVEFICVNRKYFIIYSICAQQTECLSPSTEADKEMQVFLVQWMQSHGKMFIVLKICWQFFFFLLSQYHRPMIPQMCINSNDLCICKGAKWQKKRVERKLSIHAIRDNRSDFTHIDLLQLIKSDFVFRFGQLMHLIERNIRLCCTFGTKDETIKIQHSVIILMPILWPLPSKMKALKIVLHFVWCDAAARTEHGETLNRRKRISLYEEKKHIQQMIFYWK